MNFLYNNPSLKNKRRKLRKNQTEAEKKMWTQIRNRNFKNLKFHRQFSLGKYIVDFYCLKLKLVIEIDGGQHAENQQYDEERTEYLIKEHNVKVLRF